jgi:Segment polarity protein dishevelled (Dsh) C terminal
MFKQTPENELDIFKVLHSPTVAPWHTARLYEYQEVKQCYAVPYQKATAATAAPAATTAGDTQQGGISSSGSAASIGALNVITEEPDSSNSGSTSSSSSSSSTNDKNDSPKSTDPQQQQQQTEGISKLQWLALWQVCYFDKYLYTVAYSVYVSMRMCQ